MTQNIDIFDDSFNDSLSDFLSRELKKVKGDNSVPGKLWPYIENSRRSELEKQKSCLRIFSQSAYSTKSHKLRAPEIIGGLSATIGIACLCGASRCLVNLLKIWVEDRKGRRLTIKYGKNEIIIQGGLPKENYEKIIKMFESEYGESNDEDQL